MKKILVSAGEASGDLFASLFIKEIRKKSPDTEVIGFGGDRMREAGASIRLELTKLAVVGIVEAARKIFGIIRVYSSAVKVLKSEKPDALVVVDFPGFHLKLIESARRIGIKKIIYYCTPQVWVWNRGRIKIIKKYCDLVINILPFEKQLFETAGIRAEYFGHPSAWLLAGPKAKTDIERIRAEAGLAADEKAVGIFPGSRPQEIKKFLPILMRAAELIKESEPKAKFFVYRAANINAGDIIPEIEKFPGVNAQMAEPSPDSRLMLDCGLAKSGTVTLELALLDVPELLVYNVNTLSFLISKMAVKVKYIGLPNLILNKPVIKELIQNDFTPENTAEEALKIIGNDSYRAGMLKEFKKFHELMFREDCPAATATAILTETAR